MYVPSKKCFPSGWKATAHTPAAPPSRTILVLWPNQIVSVLHHSSEIPPTGLCRRHPQKWSVNVDFDLEVVSRHEVTRGTQQVCLKCPFISCVYKAPRVPGRSCLVLGSQLGTRRGEQVIGSCCRDLPGSSEGVTGRPARRVYISADFISRRLMGWRPSTTNVRLIKEHRDAFFGRASRVAEEKRHRTMPFSNLSTNDASLGCQSHEMGHLYVFSHPRTWTRSRERKASRPPDVDRDNATTPLQVSVASSTQ